MEVDLQAALKFYFEMCNKTTVNKFESGIFLTSALNFLKSYKQVSLNKVLHFVLLG